MGMDLGMGPSPLTFFSTAAGPSISDLVGPPAGVLNIFGDGTPAASDEADTAVGHGHGGMDVPFIHRADVKAFFIMLMGGFMLHLYLKEERED